MPASVADPVACVLRTALSGKKGPFSSHDDTENAPELLEDRLAASAKRVLLSTIEYEPAPKQQVFSTDSLKSKYTVLSSSSIPSAKLAAINGLSPITSQESLPAPKVTLFRSEDVKIGWKGNVAVGAGMVNMGNTCYLNSTLQALFHVPSFANWLTSGKPCKTCENGSQNCIVCLVAKTLLSTREKHSNVVKPVPIYSRLKMICKHMVHGRQEDAHEFMRYLMEAMEKSYLQGVGATKLDSRSKETNPLGQIFGGYIRTEVTCLKCKHTSTTFQHFQDIPLDIHHASTLEDGLAHYFRRERLDGDNAYKCEKCKAKVPAAKKFSLERAPNVLCIQLKRFGLMGGKMSKHIQFSRTLNLSRFLFNQSAAGTANGGVNGSSSYKFVSLVNHMGPSQHCGHYTAIAEASNGSLYLFDDCSVRLINANTALSTGAYILIYERVPPSVGASPAPVTPVANGSTKTNGFPSSPSVATVAPPPPKAMVPRPALITEPSRPKVSITFKKSEPVPQQQQKPRLVIRNGATLFKTGATLGPVQPVANQTNGEQPATTTSKPLLVGASSSPAKTTSPLKPPTALVPYDGESSDEELEKSENAENAGVPPLTLNGNSNGSCTETLAAKATEAKWQVSPSPSPTENHVNGTAPSGTSAGKWRVSDNNQQDNSSNSTSCSSGGSQGKWNVKSMSDTEAEKSHSANGERKPCSSDNETDKKPSSSSAEPSTPPRESSAKAPVSPVRLESPKPAAVANEVNGSTHTSPRVSSSQTEEKAAVTEAPSPRPPGDVASPADKPAKGSTTSKWDGSRGGDTVKELLRMSHSGFGDQVRTWDGGKSHLTKQVEEDKRMQRKRTADELLDEEMDKGKVKKVKTKEENRESSPTRNGYNPFQLFQDRKREQQQQQNHHHHHHKPDHFKNDFSRNHNRNGYQGHRGGRGSRGGRGCRGGRGGSSDRQYHHRSQPWRRFR